MNLSPGNLVSNRWAGYTPMYDVIHGTFVAEFGSSEIGMVLDFRYSTTDVPYIQILTTRGARGWIRCERVEVIR